MLKIHVVPICLAAVVMSIYQTAIFVRLAPTVASGDHLSRSIPHWQDAAALWVSGVLRIFHLL